MPLVVMRGPAQHAQTARFQKPSEAARHELAMLALATRRHAMAPFHVLAALPGLPTACTALSAMMRLTGRPAVVELSLRRREGMSG